MSPVEVAERLTGGGLLGEGPGPGRPAPQPRRGRRLVLPPAARRRAGDVRRGSRCSRAAATPGPRTGCALPDDRRGHRRRRAQPGSSTARWSWRNARPTARATGCWRRCARTVAGASATPSTRSPVRTPGTTPSWPRKPRWVCGAPTNRPGWNGRCPTSTTCAPRSSGPSPTATPTWRCGWRRRWASSRTCASATSRGVGGAGAGARRPGPPACGPPRSARRRAARGTAPSSRRARRLVALAAGREPLPGTSRTSYPADVLADVQLYEGDVDPALGLLRSARPRARRHDDPIRLVWTLYYVAICHAVNRQPAAGVPAAEESLRVAEETANPTARSMARYALGLVLKKTEPDASLALFEEAATLAASVRNFWWHGIALMEAAATRARARRRGAGRAPSSSTSSTTGTASATGRSSGSTSATSPGCWPASAPTTTPLVLHRCLARGGQTVAVARRRPARRHRCPDVGGRRRRARPRPR